VNSRRILIVTSLLSILLFAFHLTEDIVRGMEPGKVGNYPGILIMAAWLYATVVLSDRISGHVLMLLGGLLGAVIPLAHMRGAGMAGGRVAGSEGVSFFVFTLLALGVTSVVSALLAARGLLALRRVRPKHG
jgi:hypothetical protein